MRRAQKLAAGLAYQQTHEGKVAHAERQREYVARKLEKAAAAQEVTRQGSPGVQEAAKLAGDAEACVLPRPAEMEEAGAASLPPSMASLPAPVADGEAAAVIGSARHLPAAVLAAILAGEVVAAGLLRCDGCGRWCGPWARRKPHRRGRDLVGLLAGQRSRAEPRAPS